MTRSSVALTVLVATLVACIPYGDAWFHFGGQVLDGSGRPIEGATLQLFVDGRLAGSRSVEKSNASGEYRFFENSCPCNSYSNSE